MNNRVHFAEVIAGIASGQCVGMLADPQFKTQLMTLFSAIVPLLIALAHHYLRRLEREDDQREARVRFVVRERAESGTPAVSDTDPTPPARPAAREARP